MAIKIGNTDISAFKVGSGDCKIYIGDTLLYPTTPSFDGKWLARYSDSHTESAACDSTSAITYGEITSTDLVDVQIWQCVTTISGGAFYECSGLTSIDIPDSVTSIGSYAFDGCRSLTSITIGSGVISIGDWAFFYCTNLTSITVEAVTPPSLGNYVFDDANNCPIYVPAESVNVYKSASGWSTYASRIAPKP